jgi:sec-independent protein translocase protein TatA
VAGLGWRELLLVFVILLLIFGAARLPAPSRALGQSVHGFDKGLKEGSAEKPAKGDQEADRGVRSGAS